MAVSFDTSAVAGLKGNKSDLNLDQVNQAFRLSPIYQQWMTARGKPTNGRVTLTASERKGLEQTLRNNGFDLPGGLEIDAGGNIDTKSKLKRNILIGAGIAAAAFGIPAIAGAIGGPAAAGGLGAIEGGAFGLPAAVAGGSSVASGLTAGAIGAGALRYGLPVAADLIGTTIQAKAQNAANRAQQQYLDEALNYQKEQDAYNRKRQEDLDAEERTRYGTDQERLKRNEERLARLDAEDQARYGANVEREGDRYGIFTDNIAPYLATGASSNSRMADLLGLPAPPPFTPRTGASVTRYERPYDAGDTSEASRKFFDAVGGLDAVAHQRRGSDIAAAINAKYPEVGAYADPKTDGIVWPGVGMLDATIDSGKGGWSFRPVGPDPKTGPARQQTTPPPAPQTAPTSGVAQPGDARTAPEPEVTIQAPTGQTKRVPASQAAYWQGKGARVLA